MEIVSRHVFIEQTRKTIKRISHKVQPKFPQPDHKSLEAHSRSVLCDHKNYGDEFSHCYDTIKFSSLKSEPNVVLYLFFVGTRQLLQVSTSSLLIDSFFKSNQFWIVDRVPKKSRCRLNFIEWLMK